MRNLGLILLLIVCTQWGCRRTANELPANADQLLQGEWTLVKVKAKTWIGKVRVGGEKQKLHIDVSLNIDVDDYTLEDDNGEVQLAGSYELRGDSLILNNTLDSSATTSDFMIQKLTANEMELLSTQRATVRLGEAYTEGVHYYER